MGLAAQPDDPSRRVIINRLTGRKGDSAGGVDFNEMVYLLESGSDRIGALDFQHSPTEYQPREHQDATLAELQEASEYVDSGKPLPPALNQAIQHGSSIGGARPKGLDEMTARYASYEDLGHRIRAEFDQPGQTLRELFARIVFNVLSGNTDDHARNHAAFWDGRTYRLTPAYDICPQARTGGEATQAMLLYGQERRSQLSHCLTVAERLGLSRAQARDIIDHQLATIREQWESVCDEAELSPVDRDFLWGRQFLNPFALEGYAAP
ncbi:hypothetical protein L861_16715 [Litchfieldella anticariensis FP35 = DSM 16096]|uniref:HipA-like C-terminal domain-containing protein n=1 Tax=Litchfieldella anticariensis (strain DSM 16096 / CECT 5854 / CIP 108499 / LMG 22089 / FP35) TaxID=1121939 RepID=S2KM27_LITA3|nr:HipA domain-containing protein [Halomonas anticariensis]EPC01513.1 hypothetical protein L861_16715 [Halomonas anticariensis FP35 = DSM 16096]